MQLQELKQRASGNMDEPFLSPGISEKQPLHVVMVRIIVSLFHMGDNLVRATCFWHSKCLDCDMLAFIIKLIISLLKDSLSSVDGNASYFLY